MKSLKIVAGSSFLFRQKLQCLLGSIIQRNIPLTSLTQWVFDDPPTKKL